MIAKNTIEKGQLLLIEHVFTNTRDVCQHLIINNELYPRLDQWCEDSKENPQIFRNKEKQSAEKLIKNTSYHVDIIFQSSIIHVILMLGGHPMLMKKLLFHII